MVTDWSVFPNGFGILLNERLMFPEELCLWRVRINTMRSRVGWGGNETPGSLKDRYVRLAFHMRSTKLYSFWIA